MSNTPGWPRESSLQGLAGQLGPVLVEDCAGQNAQDDRGHCGGPEDQDVGQDRSDHRADQKARADGLKPRHPVSVLVKSDILPIVADLEAVHWP